MVDFESAVVAGAGLIREVVLVPVLGIDSGFEGWPTEFMVAFTGFFSLAGEVIALLTDAAGTTAWLTFGTDGAGAADFVAAVDDVPPLLGGTTCTTRCGVTVRCIVVGIVPAGLVAEYELDVALRGAVALLILSGMALDLS
jgi:hypothetical protein